MIAAAAHARNLTVANGNQKDFRLLEVKIDNPFIFPKR